MKISLSTKMVESNRQSLEDRLKELTECPICNDVLTENRIFPCLHTFCLKCIEKYRATAKDKKGKPLTCPICRREIPIPKGGVALLPHNFLIDKIIDVHTLAPQECRPIGCDICSEGEHFVDATHFCCVCQQNLCITCEQQHRKIKATAMHKCIDIKDAKRLSQEEFSRFGQRICCYIHPHLEGSIYCYTCKKSTCWQCKTSSHNSHKCEEFSVAMQCFRDQLQQNIEMISNDLTKQEDRIRLLTEAEKYYLDEIEIEIQSILHESNKLIQALHENRARLGAKLTESSNSQVETIHNRRRELENFIKKLKRHKLYMEQLQTLGNSNDFYTNIEELISQTKELAADREFDARIPPIRHLSTSELQELLLGRRKDIDEQYCCDFDENSQNNGAEKKNENKKDLHPEKRKNLLGSFVRLKSKRKNPHDPQINQSYDVSLSPGSADTDRKRSERESPDREELKTSLEHNISVVQDTSTPLKQESPRSDDQPPLSQETQEEIKSDEVSSKYGKVSLLKEIAVNKDDAVCGVAVLDSNIYVVLQSSNKILVYDSSDFTLRAHFTADGLDQPQDVTSCSFFKSIYICDWGTKHIFRVNCQNKNSQIKWSIGDDIGTLSVTTSHCVLLAGYNSNMLKQYTTRGELIKSISLDDLYKPWHAVQLGSVGFVLCQGSGVDGSHRVYSVDQHGRTLKSFGEEGGTDEGHLLGPYHLAVDAEGFVLVVDCNNRRILLLNSELKFQKEFVPRSSGLLRRPRRIFLDEESRRLYVTDNSTVQGEARDGKILIFSYK